MVHRNKRYRYFFSLDRKTILNIINTSLLHCDKLVCFYLWKVHHSSASFSSVNLPPQLPYVIRLLQESIVFPLAGLAGGVRIWLYIGSMRVFSRDDFTCPCCGENKIRQEVVDGLNRAVSLFRELFWLEVGVRITSGYRCPRHNLAVGGAPRSMHVSGLAVDSQPILPPEAGETARNHAFRWWFIALARAGFTGLGQTHRGAGSMGAIHADMRHVLKRPPQVWAPPGNFKRYGPYLYFFSW